MTNLLRIIDQGDVCNLGMVIVLLMLVGNALTDDRQKRIGMILATIALVAHGVHRFLARPPGTAEALLELTFHSLVAGGLALGAVWVLLALLAAAWRFLVAVLWGTPGSFLAAAKSSHTARQQRHAERAQREQENRLKQAEEDARQRADEESRCQSEQMARQQEEQKARENLERAEVLEEVERWYAENRPYLASLPLIEFRSWKKKYLADHVPVTEQWDAVGGLAAEHRDEIKRAKNNQESNRRINPEDV
jgi:hypothetical protein